MPATDLAASRSGADNQCDVSPNAGAGTAFPVTASCFRLRGQKLTVRQQDEEPMSADPHGFHIGEFVNAMMRTFASVA